MESDGARGRAMERTMEHDPWGTMGHDGARRWTLEVRRVLERELEVGQDLRVRRVDLRLRHRPLRDQPLGVEVLGRLVRLPGPETAVLRC